MLRMDKNLEPKFEQVTQDVLLSCLLASFSPGYFGTYPSS